MQRRGEGIGARVRSLRRLRGLSVQELGRKLQRHVHTVYIWEQGKRLPDLGDVVALSEVLEADLRWLCTGDVRFAPAGIDEMPREAVA
jgi:transcriptional regulator with XRE-family HTH domain